MAYMHLDASLNAFGAIAFQYYLIMLVASRLVITSAGYAAFFYPFMVHVCVGLPLMLLAACIRPQHTADTVKDVDDHATIDDCASMALVLFPIVASFGLLHLLSGGEQVVHLVWPSVAYLVMLLLAFRKAANRGCFRGWSTFFPALTRDQVFAVWLHLPRGGASIWSHCLSVHGLASDFLVVLFQGFLFAFVNMLPFVVAWVQGHAFSSTRMQYHSNAFLICTGLNLLVTLATCVIIIFFVPTRHFYPAVTLSIFSRFVTRVNLYVYAFDGLVLERAARLDEDHKSTLVNAAAGFSCAFALVCVSVLVYYSYLRCTTPAEPAAATAVSPPSRAAGESKADPLAGESKADHTSPLAGESKADAAAAEARAPSPTGASTGAYAV